VVRGHFVDLAAFLVQPDPPALAVGRRPKVVTEVRDLARQYTPVAIEPLAEIAQSGKQESARVSAAIAPLDRGWGRRSREGSVIDKVLQGRKIASSDKGVVKRLLEKGRLVDRCEGQYSIAPRMDTDPDWIWLPNELVTSAAGETPPIEAVRQDQEADGRMVAGPQREGEKFLAQCKALVSGHRLKNPES
jgi:hypothetical protein